MPTNIYMYFHGYDFYRALNRKVDNDFQNINFKHDNYNVWSVVNTFTPTDRLSSIQNNDWKSPIKLLSVEGVNPQ